MTGFVFKIQANMDPNHRDRIAFMRVCSGKLTRGMKAKLVRTGKMMALNAPQFFFAQERALARDAARRSSCRGTATGGAYQQRRRAGVSARSGRDPQRPRRTRRTGRRSPTTRRPDL